MNVSRPTRFSACLSGEKVLLVTHTHVCRVLQGGWVLCWSLLNEQLSYCCEEYSLIGSYRWVAEIVDNIVFICL